MLYNGYIGNSPINLLRGVVSMDQKKVLDYAVRFILAEISRIERGLDDGTDFYNQHVKKHLRKEHTNYTKELKELRKMQADLKSGDSD